MSEIKIISASCQGLHDFKKRKDLLHFYHEQKCNILCLQDTHFTQDMESDILNERATMFTSTLTLLIQGGLLSSLRMISNLLYIKTVLMTRVIS